MSNRFSAKNYAETSDIGRVGIDYIMDKLRSHFYDVAEIENPLGQLMCGDIVVYDAVTNTNEYFEVKTDTYEPTNLFIEEWSNLGIGRKGWLHNLTRCHGVYYYSPNVERTFLINIQAMKRFIDVMCLCYSTEKLIPMVLQKQYNQNNDTRGRLVPVKMVNNKIGLNGQAICSEIIW